MGRLHFPNFFTPGGAAGPPITAPHVPPRQQCLSQTNSIPQVVTPPARGAIARKEGLGAHGELGWSRAGGEAATVAGEDSELARREISCVDQARIRRADPEEAIGVWDSPGQDGSVEQLAPVLGEDGHRHDQDAQGAVRDSLLHGGPHEGQRRKRVEMTS
jgi:hypothetical protein